MARRRQNQPFRQEDQAVTPQQSSMGTATLYGAQQQYENAVEPTHNNNFAWNGQPIPHYSASQTTGTSQEQGANANPTSNAPQNAYTNQNAYSNQNAYASQGTYTNQNAYTNPNTYTSQNTYTNQNAFANPNTNQNAYSGQNAFTNQNTYAGQNSYTNQNQNQNQQFQNQNTHQNWQQSNSTLYQQDRGQSSNEAGVQQSSQTAHQTVSYGGTYGQSSMPAAGSTGNLNAAYGDRNTGINHADARNVGFQGGYTGYGTNGQPLQYGTFMRDGTQYGKGPHTIDPSKKIITAVRYGDGGISAVRFQDGTSADIAQAIGMAEAGLIEDVNTGVNREGQKTLRSYPDGDPSNNLSNLPRF